MADALPDDDQIARDFLIDADAFDARTRRQVEAMLTWNQKMAVKLATAGRKYRQDVGLPEPLFADADMVDNLNAAFNAYQATGGEEHGDTAGPDERVGDGEHTISGTDAGPGE